MTIEDYNYYDLIVVMDQNNIRNVDRIIGSDSKNKVKLLLSFAGINKDISDPWYTGNFNKTFEDIMIGLEGLYNYCVQL